MREKERKRERTNSNLYSFHEVDERHNTADDEEEVEKAYD